MQRGRPIGSKDKTPKKYNYDKLKQAFLTGASLTIDEAVQLITPIPKYRTPNFLVDIDIPLYETDDGHYKLLTREEMDLWQLMN